MDLSNLKYVIFNISELDKIDFSEVMETSQNTIRKSLDGTKTFVKYNGNMPQSVSNLTTKSKEHTHSEIMSIMGSSEWSEEIDEEA